MLKAARVWSFLFAVMLISTNGWAGQVIMKNGDRLTGKILVFDGGSMKLESEYAGTITIQWEAVREIATDNPLYLTLKDDRVIVGKVTTADNRFKVETAETGTIEFEWDAIQSLRSKEAHETYRAEVDRLRNPGLLDLWSGSANAGLSLTSGNADTANINFGFSAARKTTRDKTSVYAASLYAANSTTGKSMTTANAIRGGARYDINVTQRFFAFGQSDLEHDEFQELDLRLVLGGGLGWHVRDTDRTKLELFGGGAFNKEFFADRADRSSGELLIGQELAFQLSEWTSLREKVVVFPNLSETGEFRVNFDTSAVINLNSWLGWHVTLSDRYLSNPVVGTEKNDILLTTGVRITFQK